MYRILTLLLGFILTFQVYAADNQTLVIYSGRAEALVGPILDRFSEETGIPVDVRYGTTGTIASQILSEQEHTPADVLFFQDVGYLGILADQGLLAPLDEDLLDQVGEPYRDDNGYWLGTSARARVLAYNIAKFEDDDLDLPAKLEDLAEMDVIKAWSPVNAGYQAHVTALRDVLWGEEKTQAWLTAMEDQEHGRITSFDGNASMVAAVARGEIDIAWTNHYYLYNLIAGDAAIGEKVANYSFPEGGEDGNIVLVSGAGIVNGTPHQAQAEALLEYLVSEEVQAAFTNETFEYPTRPNVTVNPILPDLNSIAIADVDQITYTDLGPSITMLRNLNIL